MKYATPEIVAKLREKFSVGSRVVATIHDPHVDIINCCLGTVQLVDDTGTVHIKFDNGIELGAVYGIDKVEKSWW